MWLVHWDARAVPGQEYKRRSTHLHPHVYVTIELINCEANYVLPHYLKEYTFIVTWKVRLTQRPLRLFGVPFQNMAVWECPCLWPAPFSSSHQPHPAPEVDLCTHRWQLHHAYLRSIYTHDYHNLWSQEKRPMQALKMGPGSLEPGSPNPKCLRDGLQWGCMFQVGTSAVPQTLFPGEGYSTGETQGKVCGPWPV